MSANRKSNSKSILLQARGSLGEPKLFPSCPLTPLP